MCRQLSLPGLPRDTAQVIVDTAHLTCPYSKATPPGSCPTGTLPPGTGPDSGTDC